MRAPELSTGQTVLVGSGVTPEFSPDSSKLAWIEGTTAKGRMRKGDTTVHTIATGVSDSQSNSETNLAWHVGGGVAYAFTEHWAADLGYRYIDFGSMEWGDTARLGLKSDRITAHEVLLGLRYTF